ncbi:hypothetical protein HUT19_02115 [Streptomyces sp. NA02950]|uniref:hypothetical protein n=1 Tax=Streptomyces sp. NA02950 TaxID=2742137 RepID=UPI001590FA77|nr:hypothetical protein [Streptomyces sp. NA02950]QKV90695.1 hypothetical protein HUT19_02115 [Streptomyces sp. NA02950]
MYEKILEILRSALEELNVAAVDGVTNDDLLEISLYGDAGVFDSMYLVSFLTLVEDALADEYDVEVVLASERALSRMVSPFSSVRRLVDFVAEELGVAGAAPASAATTP